MIKKVVEFHQISKKLNLNKELFFKYQAQTTDKPIAMEISYAEGSYIFDINQNLLVVTNWGGDSVSIFDTESFQHIKEIKTGAQSRSFGDFILQ